jgi:hypothetical protein
MRLAELEWYVVDREMKSSVGIGRSVSNHSLEGVVLVV